MDNLGPEPQGYVSAAAAPGAPPRDDERAAAPLDYARRPARGDSGPGSPLVNAALIVTLVLIGGLTPVAARDAMREMPPLSTGLVRFGLAALLLIVTRLLWPAASGPRVMLRRADVPRLLLLAALVVPLNQICFLTGVKLANASHAGLFYAMTPVLTYLLTLAMRLVPGSIRMSAAALLAFVGAAVISTGGFVGGYGRAFLMGDALLLGAVSTWSLYAVLLVPLVARYGPLRLASWVLTLGVVLYLPAWWVDGAQQNFAALSARALGGFLFIAIGTSYFNYLLWFVAVSRIHVNRLSVSTNAAPIVCVLGAYVWHGEPITPWLVGGATLILTAITLANWRRG